MKRRYKIAIATENTYAPPHQPWFDDVLLMQVLTTMGHDVTVINWQDRTVDPQCFDGIFVSSTWNELEDPIAFERWLINCEGDGRVRLMNSRSVLEFGRQKSRIVQFLEQKACDNPDLRALLVPTYIVTLGDDDPASMASGVLPQLLGQPWSEAGLVIKPVISADGFMTRVYAPQDHQVSIDNPNHLIPSYKAAISHLAGILELRQLQGALVQQYVTGVETDGEYSLAFVGSELRNAVLKPAGFKGSAGSDDRQCVAHSDLPSSILQGARCLKDVLLRNYDDLIRFRLDFFMQDGQAKLGEVELVSPNLNLSVLHRSQGEDACLRVVQTLAEQIIARTAELTS